MDLKKIVAFYDTTEDQVKKTLSAAGLDHKASKFTPAEMQLFDEVWTLVKQDKKTLKQATDIIKKRKAKRDSGKTVTLDSETLKDIEQQADKMADQFIADAPSDIKAAKEQIKGVMIERFIQRVKFLIKTGALEESFNNSMNSDDILEAAVLPGELPALPENSSSAT